MIAPDSQIPSQGSNFASHFVLGHLPRNNTKYTEVVDIIFLQQF